MWMYKLTKQFSFLASLFFLFIGFQLQAQQNNSDSITNLLQQSSDKEKINILYSQTNSLRFNNPTKAAEYGIQAIDIAVKINDAESLAKCNRLVADIYFREGLFAKAKEFYVQSITYFNKTKNEKGKADVNNQLASINFAQGNFPAAIEGYLSALRFYEETNDQVGLLNSLTYLGILYDKQNNFSKAIEYNLRAIKLYESSKDQLRTVVTFDNIGNIYLRQGNFVKSKEYFNKSLKIYSEINNKAGIANTLNLLGDIEFKSHQNEEATKYYKRSLMISEELKMQPLIVSNLNDLGENYTLLKQYENAITSLKRSIEIAKKGGFNIELDIAYKRLAEVYTITNEKGKAQTFSALSSEIKDSLFNDSVVKQLADISLRYESEKKQTQIELLSKEQEVRATELQSERQIRKVFIGALSVLSLIFLILIYFFIQNKRIAKNLEKQKFELEQKNIAILEQTEKLNQLNSVKDRFFSIISHDLRNNLTTMKLYFDLISHPDYEPIDNNEVTKNISGSVENTIDLLENLLIWAAAQIKGVPIHIQKLNLHSLTEENFNLLNNAAFQKNIDLKNEINEHITAYGDMDMIKLVLRNLIANAIKFTSENGRIKVTSETSDTHCKIAVIDNGVGISKLSLDRLFNQHLNPTTKGTGNEKGTGLGLILCKDFIERNNGKIWVESEEGKGSSFIFELPLNQ
jgi:two-component system, sensor histidine kinase and response regulator